MILVQTVYFYFSYGFPIFFKIQFTSNLIFFPNWSLVYDKKKKQTKNTTDIRIYYATNCSYYMSGYTIIKNAFYFISVHISFLVSLCAEEICFQIWLIIEHFDIFC